MIAAQVIFVIFAITTAVLALRVRRRPAILAWAALALAFTLTADVLRPQARPFEVHRVELLFAHSPGQSFPGNHAAAALTCALIVLVFASRRWGAVLLLLAASLGFARVHGGMHYAGDIAAGSASRCSALP